MSDTNWLEIWEREVRDKPGEKLLPAHLCEFPPISNWPEAIRLLKEDWEKLRSMYPEICAKCEHADTASSKDLLS